MSKLLLLYSTLLIGVVFLLLPEIGSQIDFFLFSDVKLTGTQYIYFLCEKAVLIVLAFIIANEATEYRQAIWCFFWLFVLDLVDYLLCYNQVWFFYKSIPISMNVFKSVVFGIVILQEWIRSVWK